MNCRQVERLLFESSEGLVTRRQDDRITLHLRRCDACRRLHDELAAAGEALRQPVEWPRTAEIDRRALESWLVEAALSREGKPRATMAQGPLSQTEGASRRAGTGQPQWVASTLREFLGRIIERPLPDGHGLALGACAAALLLIALGPRLLPEQRGPSTESVRRPVDTSIEQATRVARVSRPPQGGTKVGGAVLSANIDQPGKAALGARRSALGSDKGGPPEIPPVPSSPSAERRAPSAEPEALRDDVALLNGDPVADARWWAPVRAEEWRAIEARIGQDVRVGDDFVQIPLPRLADMTGQQMAAAVAQYRREAAVVDARLARDVTVERKAIALSDLCDQVRETSGIRLAAGSSVADEKVTLFCKAVPLRDVMRQLSRPFGYTWIRSGTAGDYRYELVQDLRSQLLEEELRNRDRSESLLALERDLQRYRPYLSLTPDEALARSRTTTGPQKALLETLAEPGWAGIQMYFRLSSQELAAMRAGQEVTYNGVPRSGERLLPPDVARGILQTMRDRRLILQEGRYTYTPDATEPGAIAPAALPDASGRVHLRITQSEVGQFVLNAAVFFFTLVNGEPDYSGGASRTCGTGMSTATLSPNNAKANAALAADPALRRSVTISLAAPSGGDRPAASLTASANGSAAVSSQQRAASNPRVSTADVLEAIHRAAGLPVVGDSYTRLYEPEKLSARNVSLFEALNRLADATRLRWRYEGEKSSGTGESPRWLQFRTTNYYDERVKEVPNRLLSRWAEARRRQGMLTLEDVVEISQLTDAQLDAESMAEGAREQWGLVEWDVARQPTTRPHLRFLAGFTPVQRQEATSATGLLFSKMSLAQQQRYLALGLTGGPLESLDDLAGATLRVEYTQPGGFQWGTCGWSSQYTRWVVPLEFTPQGRRVPRPPVRERTREATLQAVRRVDPELRKALLAATCRADPRLPAEPHVVEEDQIVPTRLDLAFVYIPGSTNARALFEFHPGASGWVGP